MRIQRLAPVLIALAWSSTAAGQPPTPGAKELFYDPVAKQATLDPGDANAEARPTASSARPAAAPVGADGRRELHATPPDSPLHSERGPIGLSGWIELEDPSGGPGTQVTDRRIFHSGERIRLHFRSNVDGYLTLIQLGSSGTSDVLYPDPAQGLGDNRVAAGRDALVPGESHWLRFDDTAGEERLLVIFARSREDAAHFSVHRTMDKVQTAALVDRTSAARGSKDLVIETETRNATEIGTYGVQLSGKPVVLELVLQHR
jgi:Domain of unknown function (DUF4384)